MILKLKKMKKIKVCVTCVNGFLTYDFINSLKNEIDFKVKIIGIDMKNHTKGKIICDSFYKVSNPKEEKSYIKDIVKIYNKEKFDVIYPLSDIENYILLKNKSFLTSKNVKFHLPSEDYKLAKLLYNKFFFLEYCKKNNINVGTFYLVKNYLDVKKIISKYPKKKFILKPQKGSGTRDVFLLNNKINNKIKILESRNCYEINFKILKQVYSFPKKGYCILMPYYAGDMFDVDCIAQDGKIKEFSIRKREIKNRFMYYSTGHRLVKNTKIKKLVSQFVSKLNISGICDFDIISDNKKFYILEASSRFSGSCGVCTLGGLNFPAQMIRYIFNMKKKKYNLKFNKSFRSFLVLKQIDENKKDILLDDYIPHYSKQLSY